MLVQASRALAGLGVLLAGLAAEPVRAGGYEPVRVGGLDQSIRIEMPGDLHEVDAPGRNVTKSEALWRSDVVGLGD
jgi:hypothetical protein